MTRAGVVAVFLFAAFAARGQEGPRPLPVYLEDNHAGTLQFLARTLDLDEAYVLVLVDAHSDATRARDAAALVEGLRRVASPSEREQRVRTWRREGEIQAFDWISPLLPRPIAQVIWVRLQGGSPPGDLPPEFSVVDLADLEARLPPDLPVAVTIDLDAFSGVPPEGQTTRFREVWTHLMGLHRLCALSFAVSRPWLADDAEASRLILLALQSSLSLAHAELTIEPYGIEGPDRSEAAKQFYSAGKEPPRFDPETASPELRSLLLANANRFRVEFDRARWEDLLGRWRADGADWHLVLDGVDPSADGILRPPPGAAPALRVEGAAPGRIRRVTWLGWTPAASAYNVLPELPTGKIFVGAAPPVIEYRSKVLARSTDLSLDATEWRRALPGPDGSGVLRVSAELETDEGIAHTSRLEIRQARGAGFRAGLSEQFGLPYVFGAGFLRRGGLRGPDTGVGNDCANFLVAAWRRSGVRLPWSNPAQLRRHLVLQKESAAAEDHLPIPRDASTRGLVIHLGSHVTALWEDRPPLGTLGPEDLLVHHLGGAPEVIALGDLVRGRERKTFDVYLGPARKVAAWIALGGDVMPGPEDPPPRAVGERLRRADLAVANLETTVGSGGRAAAKRFSFQIPTTRLADLRGLHLSAVSLANNHAGDHGAEGLSATLAALDASGFGRFGAGAEVSAAAAPWYAQVKGTAVAFVAVSLTDTDLLPAADDRPGMAVLPRHAPEVAAGIAEAHRRARSVIALVHWGAEGTTAVTDEQRRWARWLVEQGADAVVGSGPHLVQAEDTIAGAPVFYSLGNLWFTGRWPAAARTAGIAWLGLDAGGRVVANRLERVVTSTPRRRRRRTRARTARSPSCRSCRTSSRTSA